MHLFLIVLASVIHFALSGHSHPGHLKQFGSAGSLINIPEIERKFPTTSQLFTQYIAKSEPVLIRQALADDVHQPMWQSDEQLENEVEGLSKINVYVELFKPPQRQRLQIKFGEFLDRYNREPLLLADNVPEILRKYLVVPHSLQCDAVLNTFQSAILIMSGTNTSPLMYGEEFDHIHCILRGNKRIVLIDTNKHPGVRQIVVPDHGQHRGPPVNPDRVDFDKFPALADADYHVANLTTADCLFVPSGWIFQERTTGSTISVIYNINHVHALDIESNVIETCSTNDTFDASFTLDQIDWSSAEHEPQNLKDLMMNLISTNSNGYEKWQQVFSKHLSYDLASDPEASSIFEEFYGIVDVNGDGQVIASEIDQINGMHQHHISDILYEMAGIINRKRKTTVPETLEPEVAENHRESLPDEEEGADSNDEELDEHLHLHHYKSDL